MNDRVIDVRNLRKSFGARKVVEGLSLQVEQGQICGFLGANGSGKTTTIRMLCGLLVPDAGEGQCIGFDIIRQAPLMRNPRAAVDDIMVRMGLADRRNQLAGELSGGWKQRLALAACVLHQPKLLLLDEPTAGVDAKARREFWDLIHDMAGEGLTVLVSTHYMDEAERCNRIVYLANGRIVVEGGADQVARQSGLITFEATGQGIDNAARALRRMSGVEAAAVFGHALHVAGTERESLERAIRSFANLEWREVEPRLEDVFIHMLSVKEAAP